MEIWLKSSFLGTERKFCNQLFIRKLQFLVLPKQICALMIDCLRRPHILKQIILLLAILYLFIFKKGKLLNRNNSIFGCLFVKLYRKFIYMWIEWIGFDNWTEMIFGKNFSFTTWLIFFSSFSKHLLECVRCWRVYRQPNHIHNRRQIQWKPIVWLRKRDRNRFL